MIKGVKMRLLSSILILFTIIFTNACEKDKKVQEESVESLPQLQTKQERQDKAVLDKMGISTDGDKIIIEPKKTKVFLEKMAKSLQEEAIKIERETKKIKSDDLGIHKESDKITIDLNKTEKVLNNFTKELESITKSLGKVFNEQTK